MTETQAQVFMMDTVLLFLLIILAITPQLMPLTRIYGASVPLNLVGHPAIHKAHRRYSLVLGTSSLAVIITCHLLASYLPEPLPLLLVLSPFIMLGMAGLAASSAARIIKDANQAEGWYTDRPTGKTASITPARYRSRTKTSSRLVLCSISLHGLGHYFLCGAIPTAARPFPHALQCTGTS